MPTGRVTSASINLAMYRMGGLVFDSEVACLRCWALHVTMKRGEEGASA